MSFRRFASKAVSRIMAGHGAVGMVEKPLQFAWNDVPGSGSPEHYWHLLLGYLLPMVREFTADGVKSSAITHLYDCGPVMNEVLVQAMRGVAPSTKITFSKSVCVPYSTNCGVVARATSNAAIGNFNDHRVASRWDLWLMHGQHRAKLRSLLVERRPTVEGRCPGACVLRRQRCEGPLPRPAAIRGAELLPIRRDGTKSELRRRS